MFILANGLAEVCILTGLHLLRVDLRAIMEAEGKRPVMPQTPPHSSTSIAAPSGSRTVQSRARVVGFDSSPSANPTHGSSSSMGRGSQSQKQVSGIPTSSPASSPLPRTHSHSYASLGPGRSMPSASTSRPVVKAGTAGWGVSGIGRTLRENTGLGPTTGTGVGTAMGIPLQRGSTQSSLVSPVPTQATSQAATPSSNKDRKQDALGPTFSPAKQLPITSLSRHTM